MAYIINGQIEIPSEEFWEWVMLKEGNGKIFLPKIKWEDECLVLIEKETNEEFAIDGVEFWEFVLLYAPDINGSNYKFSKPVLDGYDIKTNFIAGTNDLGSYIEPYGKILKNITDSWK